MPPIRTVPCQRCFSHLQGWKTNSGTTAPICQETISRVISFCDLFFINLCLLTASDKCLRYATSNKPCFTICCFFFVGTLLKTTELTRRQFVGILKVRIIAFVRIVQAVLINNVSGLLITKRSLINVLLGRCCVCIA